MRRKYPEKSTRPCTAQRTRLGLSSRAASLSRGTVAAIETETAGFFAETDRILDALLRRIEREDSELYELADKARG